VYRRLPHASGASRGVEHWEAVGILGRQTAIGGPQRMLPRDTSLKGVASEPPLWHSAQCPLSFGLPYSAIASWLLTMQLLGGALDC
jgi:hypothetical protein